MFGLLLGSWLAVIPGQAFSNEVHHFDINLTDSHAAILAFGRQAGVQVVVPGDELQGKHLNAIKGDLSVDDGLKQLLAGTGLTYHYVGNRAVALMATSDREQVNRDHFRPVAPMAVREPATEKDAALLEEIVVTAQRREERLQDVPLSAEVLERQILIERNLNSLNDVSEVMPSVHVGSNSRSANLYIRGIGSGESQTFVQSVGIFTDDIYHGRARMSGETFLDLDRIEVLKGPQSTFFGNNAIAGAFNIVTKKPTDTFDASTRELYGEHGQYAVEGAVGGPLTEALSVRVAAISEGMTGWLNNETINRDVPGENNVAGRLTLLFRPGDELDTTLKIEGSKNRNIGALALQDADCPPPAPFVAAGFCKSALNLGAPTGLGNNNIAQNSGQQILLDTSEYVLTVNYRRWDQTFTSVSGYYEYHYNENEDTDGTPLNLLNVQAPESYHQFSEELRAASPTNQPLQYLSGVYFHTDDLSFSHSNSYYFLTPTLEAAPAFASLAPYLPLGQDIHFSQPEETYSVFGSATWNATDSLTFGAGMRASWVNETYNWNLFYGTASEAYGGIVPLPPAQAALARKFANAAALGVANTLSGSRDDHALMPSARIQYSIDPAAMAYFTYGRGFKAGGFNGADTTGVAANLPFAAEHVDAYEIGLKSEWFDHKVRFNLDFFRSDYTDLQVATNVGSASGAIESLVRNAASSRSQGAELEAQWLIGRDVRISTNITYDNARYISYPNVSPTQLQQFLGQTVQDLSGRPTEFAPEWDGTVTGSYTLHLPADYQLTTSLTGIFSSSYFLTGNDDPTVREGSYARLDARLSLETGDHHWALDLIGKNLTNTDILTFGIPWPTALGSTWLQKEEPRNVAVQVRFHW